MTMLIVHTPPEPFEVPPDTERRFIFQHGRWWSWREIEEKARKVGWAYFQIAPPDNYQ
jgi:hypothetical protein